MYTFDRLEIHELIRLINADLEFSIVAVRTLLNGLNGSCLSDSNYEYRAAWRFLFSVDKSPRILQVMSRRGTDVSFTWSWWTRTCSSSKALCALIVSTCLKLKISSTYNCTRGRIYNAYELFSFVFCSGIRLLIQRILLYSIISFATAFFIFADKDCVFD